MYTLRRINKEGIESNELMGDRYSVLRRVANPQFFEQAVRDELGQDGIVSDDLRVILWSDKLPTIMLSGTETAYVVSENGQTLARL